MGFFAEFSTWLDGLLLTYVADNTAVLAAALEPLAVTLGTLYLMVWGYLCLAGEVNEPLTAGLKRFAGLAAVLALCLHLWLYNEVIVGAVFRAPAALAATLVGAFDSVSIIDQILFDGTDAASVLMERGSLLDGFSFDLAGVCVYAVIVVTAAYAMFLLSLSKVALSLLLAIGPLFLLLALFATTRKFLEAWIAQLANYALITIMTTLAAALMLHLVSTATASALAAGGQIQIAHAMRVCLAAVLTLLVMRQVLPICADLASGLALATHSAFSQSLRWALGNGTQMAGDFTRGALLDRDTSRWDSAARRSGFHLSQALRATGARAVNRFRHNTLSKR